MVDDGFDTSSTVAQARIAPISPALRTKQSAERLDGYAEDIAGTALSPDVLRLRRVRLDLAPQPEDLHVDRAIVNLGAVQAREIEQLLARQHPLRRCAERLQQVYLAVAEIDAATLWRSQPAAAEVELPAGKAVGAPLVAACQQQLARGLITAQHGADAGEELARAEGFHDVVVGAELEAHYPVGLVVLAGDDDDGSRALLPELARQLHAVLSGKAQVEHHQVDSVLAQHPCHFRPVRDRGDAQVVPAKIIANQLADRRIVVDGEDVRVHWRDFYIVLSILCERLTSSSHSPSGLRMTSAASGSSTYQTPFSTSLRNSPGCHATMPATNLACSGSVSMTRSTTAASKAANNPGSTSNDLAPRLSRRCTRAKIACDS